MQTFSRMVLIGAITSVGLTGCGSSGLQSELITPSWVSDNGGTGVFKKDSALVNLEPERNGCPAFGTFADDIAGDIKGTRGTAQTALVTNSGIREVITEAVIPMARGSAQLAETDAQYATGCHIAAFSGGAGLQADDASSWQVDGHSAVTFRVSGATYRSPNGPDEIFEAISLAYTGKNLVVVKDIMYGGGSDPMLTQDAARFTVAHDH